MRASSPICLALTPSARQGRATPFKEKKSSFRGRKRLRQKSRPARVVLPSRQIHLDESDDEEDDHTDQKADADVFIEFGVSLLPGVNLIEAVEDEVNCQEHTENQGCLTNYASGICPYLVDKIHGAKQNKK
jgi:hypothetical protein